MGRSTRPTDERDVHEGHEVDVSEREDMNMRFESWKGVAALALVMACYYAVFTHAQAQADAKAAAVMADVRKALGGEQKIAAVKGLALRADYRREMSAGPGGGGTMTFVMMGGLGVERARVSRRPARSKSISTFRTTICEPTSAAPHSR